MKFFFYLFLIAVVVFGASLGTSVLAVKPVAQTGGDLVIGYSPLEAYPAGQNVTLYFRVYNQTCQPVSFPVSSCSFRMYGVGGDGVTSSMVLEAPYDYVVSVNGSYVASVGVYPYVFQCDNTTLNVGGFVADSIMFTPSGLAWASTEDLTPLAALILLPIILAVLAMVGAATLDGENHPALKIGLFLFSYIPFYLSLWWGSEVVTRFYNFPRLTDALANGSFYLTLFFILLVSYVCIYFIYSAYREIAEEKKRRLAY